MGYTREALKGLSWIWALRVVTRVFSFLRIAIIARLLTPSLFGLYGIGALFLSFLEVFTETGINIFIIQERENLKKIVGTAWVVSILRGIAIFLIIVFLAPVVSGFFNAPDAHDLILLISLVPLIKGFINPAIVKFQKDLKFRNEFFFRGFIFMLESISSVFFVFVLLDPSGIVYGLIIGAIMELITSFLFVRPIPSFEMDKEKLFKIFSRGKWLTLGGIFNYLYHNADDAVVGKMLGTASLGIYDMAYRISMLPITEIGGTVSKVVLPVYAKISEDKIRLRKAFFRTIGGISIFILPIGVIFFIFAEPLILLFLGEKWTIAIPVFKILVIFGVVRTYLNPIFSVFLSVKKQEYNTSVSFISFIVMMLTIIPLINMFGITGAPIAVVLGILLSMPLSLYFLFIIFRER